MRSSTSCARYTQALGAVTYVSVAWLRQAGALNVRLAYTWNDPATGHRLQQWAGESLQLLRPPADERIYANFQTYQANNGAAAVYGPNFSRLASIKQKFDRENFFRRNSNIAPS